MYTVENSIIRRLYKIKRFSSTPSPSFPVPLSEVDTTTVYVAFRCYVSYEMIHSVPMQTYTDYVSFLYTNSMLPCCTVYSWVHGRDGLPSVHIESVLIVFKSCTLIHRVDEPEVIQLVFYWWTFKSCPESSIQNSRDPWTVLIFHMCKCS